jgi:exodeoxyribonuclease V alpha subunit
VERALERLGVVARGPGYHGRPLLITRNDYALGLFNGDIGIVWNDSGDGGDGTRAYVSTGSAQASVRSFPLPQVPDARTAWAISIHRSQGSEFDEVYIVLPDRDVPVLCRELIYTAITRAKQRVVLVGPDAVLDAAVLRTTRRESGLGLRLSRDGSQP